MGCAERWGRASAMAVCPLRETGLRATLVGRPPDTLLKGRSCYHADVREAVAVASSATRAPWSRRRRMGADAAQRLVRLSWRRR
jgi:hypothetical protein